MEIELRQRKNHRTLLICIVIAFGMFGFCFALVPLYNVMCKAFAINGKVDLSVRRRIVGQKVQDRWLDMQFLATNNEKLPWEFHPMQHEIQFHPGESRRITYYAKNTSDHDMTIQAIPSISPALAASHIHKTQCFCFTRQTLKSGESMVMPVVFYFDTDLPKNINTITLSYTIFDVTKGHPIRHTGHHA